MRRTFIVIAVLVLAGVMAPAQQGAASPGLATVDLNSLTPQDLVDDLVGAGVTTSNVSYTGDPTAGGTFTGGTGILDTTFESGVILSSGNIANVIGPNQTDDITANNGTPGDADLDELSGFVTFDASVLEFDFTPDADMVFFQYVFASDEYNEFVNTQFNDVFAFFVNGTNCATVNGDAVSINTINNGNPEPGGDPTPSHPELYRNNDLDDGGGTIDTEMDGLTVILTCEAPVTAGETNHIKLAIADASDPLLDSNVFLKSGSFTTTPPEEGPDISVTKTDSPDPVTGNGVVQYLASVANAGPGATGVTLMDTPSAGEIVSASGEGWTCGSAEGTATCTLDEPLGEGETASDVEILVQAPDVGETTTIENTVTVAGDAGADPNPDDNTVVEQTSVEPAGQDQAITFCPPSGCTFQTGDEPTEGDNVVNRVEVPAGGDGSIARLTEGVTTFPCGGNTNIGTDETGQESNLVPPTGYEDPTNPIVVTTTWHVSAWPVDKGTDPGLGNPGKGDAKGKIKLCTQKERDGELVVIRIPFCEMAGVATPSFCIDHFERDQNLNMKVRFLILSTDPPYRR